jgi:hypothetical protein
MPGLKLTTEQAAGRSIIRGLRRTALMVIVASVTGFSGYAPAADAADSSAAAKAFTYKTPQGVTFVVTAEGLSSIRYADRELATGAWRAGNGEDWFRYGNGRVAADKITEKSLEILDGNRARVRHVMQDITADYSYVFDGEDVTVTARLENANPAEEMAVARFYGLKFDFGRPPAGVMCTQHISYFQFPGHGIAMCHPSGFSNIGGSYAVNEAVGIGVSPSRTGLVRTLILWDHGDWAHQETDPCRNLNYFVVAPTPAAGARTYEMKLRVSPDRDWKHLLAPYKEHFQGTFGPVQYKADNRWAASFYANKSMQAVSEKNPYGFHDGMARLDLPEGVQALCEFMLKQFREGGGQGMILWGQGGEEPRGGMYRPDFDILPPEVEAQWPALARQFKEAGVRLGVTARPRHMAVRVSWKSDGIIDINADDEGHRQVLWNRFKNMIARGCTLFYLDSFGDSLEDVKLMQFLRRQMGPDIRTFAEHQCDAIMPFSGGYSETELNGDAEGKTGSYAFWSGLRNWEIYRWLAPGSQMVSRLFRTNSKAPENVEPAERFWFRNHITPLVVYGRPTVSVAELKAMQAEYVDDQGQWKDGP